MKNHFKDIQYDFPASIVLFFVALPLCLGIAMASGAPEHAPLMSGLIAGVIGGIVVGALSGSHIGVSGPAAGLAVIVLSSIKELGGFELFLPAVIVAGLLQLLMGFLRAGIIGYYFPSSVIKGMLSGIGIIIILKQIPHAFGYDKDYEGDEGFHQIDGETTLSELFHLLDVFSPGAIIIAAVSLVLLLIWEIKALKKLKFFQWVQGPLMAVLAGILFYNIFLGTGLEIEQTHLVNLPAFGGLQGLGNLLTMPDFSGFLNPNTYLIGGTIAVVASLETLLSVEATDKIDPFKRTTPTNRELKAQGVGNILTGLIGGLPLTQVIVRSSANAQSGGRTKVSAIFHGIFLVLSIILIPGILNMIPLAALASVLIVVGFKLAKPAMIKQMYSLGWEQFLPYVVTMVGVIFSDLLEGIVFGLSVGFFIILRNNYRNAYLLKNETHDISDRIVLTLSEEVTFLNKAKIIQTMEDTQEGAELIVDAGNVKSMDYDIMEYLVNFKKNADTKKIKYTYIEPKISTKTVDY